VLSVSSRLPVCAGCGAEQRVEVRHHALDDASVAWVCWMATVGRLGERVHAALRRHQRA